MTDFPSLEAVAESSDDGANLASLNRLLAHTQNQFNATLTGLSSQVATLEVHDAESRKTLDEILREVALTRKTLAEVVENQKWVVDNVSVALEAIQQIPGFAAIMKKMVGQ